MNIPLIDRSIPTTSIIFFLPFLFIIIKILLRKPNKFKPYRCIFFFFFENYLIKLLQMNISIGWPFDPNHLHIIFCLPFLLIIIKFLLNKQTNSNLIDVNFFKCVDWIFILNLLFWCGSSMAAAVDSFSRLVAYPTTFPSHISFYSLNWLSYFVLFRMFLVAMLLLLLLLLLLAGTGTGRECHHMGFSPVDVRKVNLNCVITPRLTLIHRITRT